MKNAILVSTTILLLLAAAIGFAQYTGSELERKTPENHYPHPGPGDLLIVDQLKETNRLLQEQVSLLSNQNRILSDTLTEMKKSVPKPSKP
jgi:hypothetical protein